MNRDAQLIECLESDRETLIDFKNGTDDLENRLSSWKGRNCCQWQGISCKNRTKAVIAIDLYLNHIHNMMILLIGLVSLKHLVMRGVNLSMANSLEEESFDSLIEGGEGVFHTASPVIISPTVLQAEVIDPAVKGRRNVRRSCIKFSSVKRVVVTSSIVGQGSQILENVVYRFVDVRDVACAHIQAFEVASASGRYILVGNVTNNVGISKILEELYPDLSLPERWENEKPPLPIHCVSSEKAKGLDIDFISLELSFRDTVECFKEKGFLIM
ncbi:hypothetical protein FEM48_Zijuj05G0014600 [Ziziphus jujuba var. spinosa]|uniref:Leucine-rich repeat-containing N-terminal plant-type domain-containing protein n=1 Tax=Ziziphus jujuba var. spinosa TaxID=714518 RepID=A0A978VC03_ZIZJJ|nr:hypothetical protein FEM48_Zijuj05G0014600 [Ziziphus jujuba var. spinosa]